MIIIGILVWIGISDDSLFSECIEKGVKVFQQPPLEFFDADV